MDRIRLFLHKERMMVASILFAGLIITACALYPLASETPTPVQSITPSPSLSPSPSATRSPSSSPTVTIYPNPKLPPWQSFPAPILTPITPIPLPARQIDLPEEVHVLALLGMDREAPYVGRTDGVLLVIYHPRLGRAALVSLPSDLFLYQPGYTMQRLSVAYAAGGIKQFSSTLQYNLGIKVDQWAVVNLGDFSRLVDDLGGLDIHVLRPYPGQCEVLRVGYLHLTGQQTLCYTRLRQGSDEIDRNLRQQEVFRLVFLRLVQGGNLIQLPKLYDKYKNSVQSNLTLDDLLGYIPLSLTLGDPNRIGFFTLDPQDLTTWDIPGQVRTQVLLTQPRFLKKLVKEALDFVQIPASLSDVVVTLQHELTVSPTVTKTPTFTPTWTATPLPTRTNTHHPTSTFTPAPSKTKTFTPTATSVPDIAYSYADGNGNMDLMTLNLVKTTPFPVLNGDQSTLLDDWSPDGNWLLYEQGGSSAIQLYRVHPNGSGKFIIVGQPPGSNTPATYSPDGNWIVFRNLSREGQADLYVSYSDGSSPIRLTNDIDDDTDPSWSPDGRQIIFVRNRDIYSLDVGWLTDSSAPIPPEPMPLPVLLIPVSTADEEASPRWHTSRLVFARKVSGHWNLFSVFMDWSEPEINLTNDNTYDNTQPDWSNDGKWIAFISNRGGHGDRVYKVSPTGGSIYPVTGNDMKEERPKWRK